MKPKYKAVLFDLDGTLLYTLEDLYRSVNHALAYGGLPLRTIDEIQRFIGNGVNVLMHRAVPEGTPEEITLRLLEVFRVHYLEHMHDHTRLYDGIDAVLAALQAQGVKMAIVSNKLDAATKEMNERYFARWISTAIGAPPEHKKPDPTSVFLAMEQLGVTHDECVYVGDSDVDAETASRAGIPCIGAAWGFRGRDFLAALGLSEIADVPTELLDYLLVS